MSLLSFKVSKITNLLKVQVHLERYWSLYPTVDQRMICSQSISYHDSSVQFSSVTSRVRFFATPWIPAHQASLSIIISRSSLRLMSIKSVMPSSHLILGRPLLLLPPIPSSIRVFSNESTLCMRWPKYWSFSLSISPSNEYQRLVWRQCIGGQLRELIRKNIVNKGKVVM